MALIEVTLLLFVAVAALLVLIFDALGRVLMGAVAAIVRAPWRGGQLLRSWFATRPQPDVAPAVHLRQVIVRGWRTS